MKQVEDKYTKLYDKLMKIRHKDLVKEIMRKIKSLSVIIPIAK